MTEVVTGVTHPNRSVAGVFITAIVGDVTRNIACPAVSLCREKQVLHTNVSVRAIVQGIGAWARTVPLVPVLPILLDTKTPAVRIARTGCAVYGSTGVRLAKAGVAIAVGGGGALRVAVAIGKAHQLPYIIVIETTISALSVAAVIGRIASFKAQPISLVSPKTGRTERTRFRRAIQRAVAAGQSGVCLGKTKA